jgi:hypothetical protein
MRTVSDPALADGLQAYTYEQANLQDSLSKSFLAIWGNPTDNEQDMDDHGDGGGCSGVNKDDESEGEDDEDENDGDEDEGERDGEEGKDEDDGDI